MCFPSAVENDNLLILCQFLHLRTQVFLCKRFFDMPFFSPGFFHSMHAVANIPCYISYVCYVKHIFKKSNKHIRARTYLSHYFRINRIQLSVADRKCNYDCFSILQSSISLLLLCCVVLYSACSHYSCIPDWKTDKPSHIVLSWIHFDLYYTTVHLILATVKSYKHYCKWPNFINVTTVMKILMW